MVPFLPLPRPPSSTHVDRRLVGAALLAPLAYTAYLAPFGITGLGGDVLPTAVVALCLLYLLPLAALGAGVVVGVGRRLHVTLVVAGCSLLVLPAVVPSGLHSLSRVGVAVSMLVVGCGVLGVVEHALRTPQQVRERLGTAALATAGVVGAAHAALVLWVVSGEYAAVVDSLGLWLGWGAVGMLALGAVPTLLLLRHSLVTPGLVVVVLTANAVRTDLFAAPVDSLTPLYLVGWFLVLPAVVALGAVEYVVRRRLGVVPPRALVGDDGEG
ncbi:hypothetical protein [Salinigranum salinum]|uniref:hypothetical protein n=1 Tax=Salinigranum salinum TaxID=1364937 RepID=UPI00126083BC|nr:hypothetical protein [Salinigranum salinum]